MAKRIIEVNGQIEIWYDKNSPEFKDALESYQEAIDKTADEIDMIKQVAYHVNKYGTDMMVEGVGYIGYNGRIPKEKPYSGIMISEDYDEFTFDVID